MEVNGRPSERLEPVGRMPPVDPPDRCGIDPLPGARDPRHLSRPVGFPTVSAPTIGRHRPAFEAAKVDAAEPSSFPH